MGILSSEQYDDMVSKMEAAVSGEEQPEVSAQSEETQQSADSQDSNQAEDGSSPSTDDVKEEVETRGNDSEPEAPKVPESIPYGRFKEVNEKFRTRERELQQAQQRIRDLEHLTLQQQQPKKDAADKWLDDLLDTGKPQSESEIETLRSELQAVKSWQVQRMEQLVSDELEREVSTAAEKYPDVEKKDLWQAVAADGSVDVDAVASHIQKGREQMRSQYTAEAMKEVEALKAQLEEAKKAAEEAKTFRRPGSAALPSSAQPNGQRPRTVSEATSAFAEALRERMSF